MFCVLVCLLYVWFVSVLFVPSVLWYCWLGLLTCKNSSVYMERSLIHSMQQYTSRDVYILAWWHWFGSVVERSAWIIPFCTRVTSSTPTGRKLFLLVGRLGLSTRSWVRIGLGVRLGSVLTGMDWIVQCFTSPPTQYTLYRRRFLQVKRPNQQYQSTEGESCKGKTQRTKKTQNSHA